MRWQWLVLSALICFMPAHAVLDLSLTRGLLNAVPIVLVPFASTDTEQAKAFARVVQSDLVHSGCFDVQLEKSPLDEAASPVMWQQWRANKRNAVLSGRMETLGDDRYRVTMHLDDLFGGTGHQPLRPLVTRSFEASKQGLRALAHHVSDMVHEQLTGDRGVYSTKVAYVMVDRHLKAPQYILAVSDVDGYNEQVVLRSPEPIMSPTWRPDGKALAYVSFEGKRGRLYEQDLATGKRMVLSCAPGINGAPAYAPDGQSMALVLSVSGYPKLYSLNLHTRALKQLTHGWSIDTEPAWAPDGRSLYFTSNRGGSPQIYRLDVTSGHSHRVSYAGRYNTSAKPLPDGRALVVLHRDAQGYAVALVDVPTGRLTPLTTLGDTQSPTVSPNGRMVLFASRLGDRALLEMVSVDGRVQMRLPARAADVQEPTWSPFLG